VLALLAEGKSNPAFAEALYISQRTVTTHRSRLYAKLDVSTRSRRRCEWDLCQRRPTVRRLTYVIFRKKIRNV